MKVIDPVNSMECVGPLRHCAVRFWRYIKRFPGATAAGRQFMASFGRKKHTALRAVLVARISGDLLDKTFWDWEPSLNLGGNVSSCPNKALVRTSKTRGNFSIIARY